MNETRQIDLVPSLSASELRALSLENRLALFMFCVLPGNHTVACLAAYVKALTGREPNVPKLQSADRKSVV